MAEILNMKPAESKGARIVVVKEPGAETAKTEIDGSGADILGLLGVAVAAVVQVAVENGAPLNMIAGKVFQMAAQGIDLALAEKGDGKHE